MDVDRIVDVDRTVLVDRTRMLQLVFVYLNFHIYYHIFTGNRDW